MRDRFVPQGTIARVCWALLLLSGGLSSYPSPRQSPAQLPPLIKENSVVFLGPSQKEYDALVSSKAYTEEGLIEWLSDYYHYAEQYVAPRLKELGIDVRFETWKEMRYRDQNGKETTLIREEFAGIVMYPRGKPPVIAIPWGNDTLLQIEKMTFYPGAESMAEVISEYFGVKVWK